MIRKNDMSKSSSGMSKAFTKACNFLTPYIRALLSTQKLFWDVFYGLTENNWLWQNIFKMMAVTRDPEPEPSEGPTLLQFLTHRNNQREWNDFCFMSFSFKVICNVVEDYQNKQLISNIQKIISDFKLWHIICYVSLKTLQKLHYKKIKSIKYV